MVLIDNVEVFIAYLKEAKSLRLFLWRFQPYLFRIIIAGSGASRIVLKGAGTTNYR